MPLAALLLVPSLSTAQQRPFRPRHEMSEMATASVVVDGKFLEGGVLVSKQNRVLVEMRPVFERLGAKVDWQPNLNKVTAFTPKRGIELTINSKMAKLPEETTLDSPPLMVGGRVFIPLRAVSQAFDAKVRWDANRRRAFITTSKSMPRNDPSGVDQGGSGLGAGGG